MYDNEYEWDILLFLRILKYLHTSDTDMVNAIIRDYPEVDVEDPDMIMYDLLWAFFDEEPEETDDEFYTVRFSDQSIDRLYQLGCQDGDIFSSKFRMWQEKIKDIFLFYVVGASHSVFDVAYHFTGDGVKIDITLSPDCYEPILFLNSIINMILYDVVKSTGEVKDTFKFTYSGRRYDRLSLSEKIRAGMEVSELIKRLTGRNYPVFVDNMESVDDLANVRPTGQIIMAKCVSNAPLQVRPIKPIVFAEQRAA